MKFSNYDMVKIRCPFSLVKNGHEVFFESGIDGVIVESYDGEYLIEFVDKDSDTLYALIKEADIVKTWDAESEKHVD